MDYRVSAQSLQPLIAAYTNYSDCNTAFRMCLLRFVLFKRAFKKIIRREKSVRVIRCESLRSSLSSPALSSTELRNRLYTKVLSDACPAHSSIYGFSPEWFLKN